MPNSKEQQDHLIDSLYDLALDPRKFQSFAESWEQYLQDHQLNENGESVMPPRLARHFGRALTLLEKMGRENRLIDKTELQIVEERTAPCLILNTNQVIKHANSAASELLSIREDHLRLTQYLHPLSQKALLQALTELAATRLAQPLFLVLPNKLPALALLQNLPDSNGVLMDISGAQWNTGMATNLQRLYELTKRECDIASHLFQGRSLREIAELENRSMETIRKQTKAILNKTDTHSQTQLVRLLTSLSISQIEDSQRSWTCDNAANYSFSLADGRNLAYYDSGENSGETVVVLHGIVHDPELPKNIHQKLCKSGYRVIGICRPWYGDSSPPKAANDLLNSCADDLRQLLDHLQLNSVTLLGCMSGFIHACAMSVRYPERVNKIIGLSSMVPFTSETQIKSLPKTLRAVAHTARYFPKLLPLLIRTGVALLDKGDIQKLFDTGYRSSPIDYAATKRPEVHKQLSRGFHFAIKHGYLAYTYEGIAVAQDLSELTKKLNCTMHLIHGVEDGLNPVPAIEDFIRAHQDAKLSLIQEAGHLAIYTHSTAIAKLLMQALRTS